MKTNFKYIKTIAAIFLALVIYSCHDELIEQQDLSNTNQEFSKKPSNKSIEYWGRFIVNNDFLDDDDETVANQLVSLPPAGNSSSLNFTIQWQPGCTNPGTCDPVFNLHVTGVNSSLDYHPNYQVQISLFKKAGMITGFQMWLHDGTYRFSTDKFSFEIPLEFPAAEPNVVIPINETVVLYRNIKGSGSKKRESVGNISIGSLEYCRKDQTCAGWLD